VYEGPIHAFTEMDNNISLISVSPLLNLSIIKNILIASKAVIIQAYGMGNIPSKNKELLNVLNEAINQKDVIVVILT
jgi:L-asparaginase/Glu-tRNA(Gln) amidotransferase subunit D